MNLHEAAIRDEIFYFERKAEEVSDMEQASTNHTLREAYLPFAQRRRQLLAALRDGRPEAWRQYPAEAL